MSKIKLTGSNSGYVEISSAADAGNLTLALPTSGTALLSNADNVFSGITTFTGLNITDDVTFNGGSYDVLWDASDNQLEFGDNAKLSFGASSDLQLYHDGNHSYIHDTGTGTLRVQSSQMNVIKADGSETMAIFVADAEVGLFFNNSKKIETTNTGAVVTGICTATSFSGSGENLTRTTQLSHRNLIINGAMLVAQRGTSSTSGPYTTIDRMACSFGGTDEAITQAQVDVASGTTPYSLGFRKAFKITNGNQTNGLGSNDIVEALRYRVESQDMANCGWNYTDSNSFITLSFWVKSSVSFNMKGYFFHHDGTSQSYPLETGTLSANTWTKIERTIPGNSNVTFDNNNEVGLTLSFGVYGSNFSSANPPVNQWITYSSATLTNPSATTWYTTNDATLEFTGLQLEVGEQATPFEHRSFAEELNRCKRYFQSSFPSNVAPQNGYYATNGGASAGYAGATCFSASNARSPQIYYATEMRAQPSVTLYASSNSDTAGKWGIYSAGSGWTTPTSHQVDYFSNRGFGVRYNSASFGTAGESYLYRGMWAADAEL